MTDRKAKQRRLERAGYRYYEGGWLPKKNPAGPAFEAQLEAYRADIAEMLEEPAKQRGRPPLAIKRVTDTPLGRTLADLYAKLQHREISMDDYARECAKVRASVPRAEAL